MNKSNQKSSFCPQENLTTPVLFLIFNRPETTQKVFAAIKKAKPPRLYVSADGPRPEKQDEEKLCKITRSIATNVDWKCEVKTLFQKNNLGCRLAVSQANEWFFEQEPEGIILEDDCLPDQSFFWFCQELLNRYRDDKRIMHIGGVNFQFGKKRTEYSYYFSRYANVWGWASWRRAWLHFDEKMKLWPDANQNEILKPWADDKKFIRYWSNIFKNTADGETNAWSYQWNFACWSQNGLSVVPSVNLVSNIGFSKTATHTTDNSPLSNMVRKKINFPMNHPIFIVRHFKADRYVECQQYSRPFLSRIFRKMLRIIRRKN